VTAEAPVLVAPAAVPAAGPPEAPAEEPVASPQAVQTAPAAPARATVELAERVDVEFEAIDLGSLIGERPQIGQLALATVDGTLATFDDIDGATLEEPSIDTLDLATLLGERDDGSRATFDDLAEAFERQDDELEKRATFAQTLVGGSVGLTSGISVGYLIWLIRGGTLVSSVLSSLPAWRFVDPLPVLDGLAGGADDDEESLESMVADGDTGEAALDSPPVQTPPPSSAVPPEDGGAAPRPPG